jgi:hypothetical protein
VRASGRGASWEALETERERIVEWVEQDLSVVKIGELLGRRGVPPELRIAPEAGLWDRSAGTAVGAQGSGT